MTELTCPYCGGMAVLRDSAVLHHGHSYGNAWVCENWPACDAYVGCHRDTDKPLGTMANEALRKERNAAHAAFDRLWRKGPVTRNQAYEWLAMNLYVLPDKCHIAMFNVATCRKVVEVCDRYWTARVTPGGHTEQQMDQLVERIRKT